MNRVFSRWLAWPAWCGAFSLCLTLCVPALAQPSEEPPAQEAAPTEEAETPPAEESETPTAPALPDLEIEPPPLETGDDEYLEFEEFEEFEDMGSDPLGVDLSEDPLESSRELLRRAGVGESHLRFLIDGRPLHIDEQETLQRILYNLPRFTLANLDRWKLENASLDQLAADPAGYRAAIVRVMGRVRAIHSRELMPAMAERFLFKDYYEVELVSYENDRPVRIFAREIPAAWEPLVDSREPIDEQASAVAMFLKAGTPTPGERADPNAETTDQTTLYFAARRIAWHPDRVDPEMGVIPDHVKLSVMGMDVGQFAEVVDGAELKAEDRECFYQLLFAARKATPERLGDQSITPQDMQGWLKRPAEQHGKFITIAGVCRQASEVIVDDADIQSRFGIDHYYELVIFVPLEVEIHFTRPDGEPEIFTEYPFVVCVRELPEGMPIGPNIREPVEVTGVYCKLYGYRTERFDSDSGYIQTSPLLVGREPKWLNKEPERNPWIGPIIGGLFVLALGGVWISLWLYGRGDRAFQKEVLEKRRQQPEKSLNDMGIEASGEPDFSNLD